MNLSKPIMALAVLLPAAGLFPTAPLRAQSHYQIFRGNTHAHTFFTQSHGAHLERIPGHDKYMTITDEHLSKSINTKLKPDWEELQGPPAAHFALAKKEGYDFYISTDHSQEATFYPAAPDNPKWVESKREAREATNANFVALTGFECSENNGPVGRGHINVINTAGYVNALAPDVDIPAIYEWLKKASPNGEGPVVATFNHPGREQYDNWAHRDPEITGIITMLEVINSNKRVHYDGFVAALDHGWKVSPVCGNDNHNLWGISNQTSRTFVLAEKLEKAAILEAMRNRRTYASLEGNIQCRYSVNGAVMGSTLSGGASFRFDISVSDPDTDEPGDRITRIDIVKDGGVVVETYRPEPAHAVSWSPEIRDNENKYFFIRVWNAGGGDASNADPEKPVAWLAPVWTGR